MTVGESMRNARKRAGLTRDKLSQLSGVAKSNISMYETDKVNPTITKVELLADALNISIDEYIGRDPRGTLKEIQLSTRLKTVKEFEYKFLEFIEQMLGDSK